MDSAIGAKHAASPEASGLPSATRDVATAATRFFQAFAGLFGLELRETGVQALILISLVAAFLAACGFAYLFVLTGLIVLLVSWLGGGWLIILFGLALLHGILAVALWFILRDRIRQPLFPGTREALRCEVGRYS